MLQHSELIYVKKVIGKGRGVFARRAIKKGSIIERVPVVLVPVADIADGTNNPSLARFCFTRNKTTVAIALGYGSLYNHSYKPNARYDDDAAAQMIFTAVRDIAADEEITINYNGAPGQKGAVGFPVI